MKLTSKRHKNTIGNRNSSIHPRIPYNSINLKSSWTVCKGDSFGSLCACQMGRWRLGLSLEMEAQEEAICALSIYLASTGGHAQIWHHLSALLAPDKTISHTTVPLFQWGWRAWSVVEITDSLAEASDCEWSCNPPAFLLKLGGKELWHSPRPWIGLVSLNSHKFPVSPTWDRHAYACIDMALCYSIGEAPGFW